MLLLLFQLLEERNYTMEKLIVNNVKAQFWYRSGRALRRSMPVAG
jgi:hypothetical protein